MLIGTSDDPALQPMPVEPDPPKAPAARRAVPMRGVRRAAKLAPHEQEARKRQKEKQRDKSKAQRVARARNR